jgi:hypothetical protein|tara:strand:- start:623 stop:727 length:105 start_codon:yes stop_codon:yes gene_type:complete
MVVLGTIIKEKQDCISIRQGNVVLALWEHGLIVK